MKLENKKRKLNTSFLNSERETRLELATPTLASRLRRDYQLSYSRKWYPGRDFPPDRVVRQGTRTKIKFIGFITQIKKPSEKSSKGFKKLSGKRDSNSRPRPWHLA
jgi:hypothetical protein